MQELIAAIDTLLELLSQKPRERESLEWYLANNLDDYKRAVQDASDKGGIEDATRALNRFCTESMDWDNDLFRRCSEIVNLGFKLSKS
jgi:hypothetical protein